MSISGNYLSVQCKTIAWEEMMQNEDKCKTIFF